jgi:hypothetical protein
MGEASACPERSRTGEGEREKGGKKMTGYRLSPVWLTFFTVILSEAKNLVVGYITFAPQLPTVLNYKRENTGH